MNLTWDFGMVDLSIPVAYIPVDDPILNQYKDKPTDIVSATTPVLYLGLEAMFFGDSRSFSAEYFQLRNKYRINHENGHPQLGKLIQNLKLWRKRRKISYHIEPSSTLIVIPTPEWPIAILIQIVNEIKQQNLFKNVILGNQIS